MKNIWKKIKKMQGGTFIPPFIPLIEIENFRKKSHSAEKTKGGPFGLASTFGSIKNLWFSARIEATISCFRKLVEQMNKRL